MSRKASGSNPGSKRNRKPGERGPRSNKSGRTGEKVSSKRGNDQQKSRNSDRGRPHFKTDQQTEIPSLTFSPKHRWVAGIHSCREALKVRPHAVQKVFVKQGAERAEQYKEIFQLLSKNHIAFQEVLPSQLDNLTSGHQGIALSVNEDPQVDWKELETADKAIVLILDGIEDPHNFGAILRTAWLMGVKAVIIPKDRSVGLVPTACKVASGGAEHIPVEVSSAFTNEINDLKQWGFWVYGLAEKGDQTVYDLKMSEKAVWIIGAEDKGMRIATEKACDILTKLPQVHSGSSYNASVAAALALGETCRQLT